MQTTYLDLMRTHLSSHIFLHDCTHLAEFLEVYEIIAICVYHLESYFKLPRGFYGGESVPTFEAMGAEEEN
jgi:hypothetical protein